MQWKPHLTVAAVIEQAGKFLLVEEDINGRRLYNQPAGHLERDETLLAAVQREVREETARAFTPQYLIGIYQFNPQEAGDNIKDNDARYIRVCFAGRCQAYDAQAPLDVGIIQTLWLSRAELLARRKALRTPLVLRCIDDYIDGRRYSLDLLRQVQTQAQQPA